LALTTPTSLAAAPSQIAKALLDDALAPVAADLLELNAKLSGYLPSESKSARAVIDHVFGSGGKRIRPALYFMCCRLFDYRGPHRLPIAAVAEFVHTASLLHDDVVDNSTLRRNKPTANTIWGDETSVLVGDLIYSTASELMAATGVMEIVRTFARAIRMMSDGELLQLENLYNPRMPVEAYLRILECKTAALIEAACKSAGLLAGASETHIEALARFGGCVGLAFQLIDDALDYTGSAEIVGKSTLSDLVEGKVTMPVILLRGKVTDAEDALLRRIIAVDGGAEGVGIDRAGVQVVAELVDRYDTVMATIETAHGYTHQAMQCLARLPASPQRDDLETLAN
jgi:octaprenyl-diphosphate synthase